MSKPITSKDLTSPSLELFKFYAQDAGNWSGTPCTSGNLELTPARKGSLTDLKRKKLLTTFEHDGLSYVEFTPAALPLAKELGIDLSDYVKGGAP